MLTEAIKIASGKATPQEMQMVQEMLKVGARDWKGDKELCPPKQFIDFVQMPYGRVHVLIDGKPWGKT